MWLDSHCHISADAFDADREAVLARAVEAGVEAFVAIGAGYGVAHNARAIALAEADERIFAAVGVHPHDAEQLDDAGRAQIEAWLDHPRVVAMGECGLDYYYMNSDRDVQRRVLAEQLAIARERRMPVSLHVRGDEPDAFAEFLEIWRAEGRGELEGVLHCYTGTLEFARQAVTEGLRVSFSGILTFKRAEEVRDVARGLALEHLMVETDAPLLAPQGFRGKRTEPQHVGRVGRVLAEPMGLPVEDVAAATTRNARELFRLGS